MVKIKCIILQMGHVVDDNLNVRILELQFSQL